MNNGRRDAGEKAAMLQTMNPTGIDLGELPTTMGALSYPNQPTTPLGPRNDLLDLRSQFPFVPIMPWPVGVIGVIAGPTAPSDMVFPDGTVAFILSGNGDYYASMQGPAEIPTVANLQQNKSIFRPEFSWFYTKSNRISIIAPNANTHVQALCVIPSRMPGT
jgi:hypothetical protein